MPVDEVLDGEPHASGHLVHARAVARGFAPRYRIGVARAGDGVMRLEAVAT